jgi:hypothetical protein
MFCSVAKDVSPPAAAEQVKVRAYLRERVTRGINAVNPWDWVEDDLPPLRRLLVNARGQSYCPEGDLRSVATLKEQPGAQGSQCHIKQAGSVAALCSSANLGTGRL